MPYKDPEIRKQKQKQYAKAYYERNLQKHRLLVKDAKRRRVQKWNEFKKTLFCIKCNENHPAALDFHHTNRHKDNPKIYTIIRNRSWEFIMKELEKCVVLCANCHRKLHHHEHQLSRKVTTKGSTAKPKHT